MVGYDHCLKESRSREGSSAGHETSKLPSKMNATKTNNKLCVSFLQKQKSKN